MAVNEIIYSIESPRQLTGISPSGVRWVGDLDTFNSHMLLCGQKPLTKEVWRQIRDEATRYAGLFINNAMVARAAVEKYSSERWEAADVRVASSERNKGYARQVTFFVSRFILDCGKTVTIRTRADNIAMQRVISSLGFSMIGD